MQARGIGVNLGTVEIPHIPFHPLQLQQTEPFQRCTGFHNERVYHYKAFSLWGTKKQNIPCFSYNKSMAHRKELHQTFHLASKHGQNEQDNSGGYDRFQPRGPLLVSMQGKHRYHANTQAVNLNPHRLFQDDS